MIVASDTQGAPLPQGVGRMGGGSIAILLLALAVLAWGLQAFWGQLQHGEIVTGMRTIGAGGVAWGLYIAFYVYMVGVSFAGITVSAIIRLFGIATLRPLARLAELLTIVALLCGALGVLADLGRPLAGLLNLPAFARPMSPFFGTFTLVTAGYLFASMVYFYLAGRADAAWLRDRTRGPLRWCYRLWASGYRGTALERRRHHHASFWLSLAILPVLVMAHSTLGFVFGIQGGRPGWYSALQAPSFVVMAGVSGIGALILVAGLVRGALRLHEHIKPEAFRWLSNLLLVLIVTYLYFMLVEELTANYASAQAESGVAHEVVFGRYAAWFWTVVATLVIPLVILFTLFVRGRSSVGWSMLCGATVQIAAMLKRLLIVVPSQTHGMLIPYPEGEYVISATELSVTLGMAALGVLMFVAFLKVFPIVPMAMGSGPEGEGSIREPLGRRTLRLSAFVASLLLGLALTVGGLALSARFGTLPYQDPLLPFSPAIFILGVMACFYSAAVYEIIPGPLKPKA